MKCRTLKEINLELRRKYATMEAWGQETAKQCRCTLCFEKNLLWSNTKMAEMDNPRDTQFAGFAELLLAEIADTDGWMLADVEKKVAQRAYDFAYHVLYCNGIDSSCWNDGRGSDIYKRETISKVNTLPDMIRWTNE